MNWLQHFATIGMQSVLLIVLSAVLCTSLSSAQSISRLDSLLESGMTVELAAEFKSGRYGGRELDEWLRRHAEEGHALPQYELASRLGKNRLDEALKWFARGRLSRVLDSAECSRSNHSGSVGWGIDLTYQDVETLSNGNDAKFSQAIDEALKWDGSRLTRISPKWICGDTSPSSIDGAVLPKGMRETERRAARERLIASARNISEQNRLLAQPINPDGFEATVAPFMGAPLRWLDNERLYVSLATGIDSIPSELRIKMPDARYVIWNVKTGFVEQASILPDVPFCYFNGYVSYSVVDGDYVVFFEGPIGAPREKSRKQVRDRGKPLALDGEVRRPNHFSCRWTEFESVAGGRKYFLLDGHGYILSQKGGKELYFVGADAKTAAVPLPFSIASFWQAIYSQQMDAYIFPENISGSGALRLWILRLDGSITNTVVPSGPWFGASRGIHVSKAGVVVWSHRRAGRSDDGFAGIYLSRNSEVVRLMSGFVGGSDVSPDGCRIAAGLGHDNRKPELKVIDVCKRGN